MGICLSMFLSWGHSHRISVIWVSGLLFDGYYMAPHIYVALSKMTSLVLLMFLNPCYVSAVSCWRLPEIFDSWQFCGHSFSTWGSLAPYHLWRQGHPWAYPLLSAGKGCPETAIPVRLLHQEGLIFHGSPNPGNIPSKKRGRLHTGGSCCFYLGADPPSGGVDCFCISTSCLTLKSVGWLIATTAAADMPNSPRAWAWVPGKILRWLS